VKICLAGLIGNDVYQKDAMTKNIRKFYFAAIKTLEMMTWLTTLE
jgi:hypothetical protein